MKRRKKKCFGTTTVRYEWSLQKENENFDKNGWHILLPGREYGCLDNRYLNSFFIKFLHFLLGCSNACLMLEFWSAPHSIWLLNYNISQIHEPIFIENINFKINKNNKKKIMQITREPNLTMWLKNSRKGTINLYLFSALKCAIFGLCFLIKKNFI